MIDKASLIKEAQKHLSKGHIGKAIVEWEKLVNAYPDGNTFNYIGDLYLKKGDKQPALAAFHKASNAFKKEGFTLKALAIYKKILNINPSDADALYALGELNEEKNMMTDAIKYYLAAADALSRENRRNDIPGVFDRILKLAPTNIPLRVKISELFSKEGFVVETAKEYLQIGLLYEDLDKLDQAREYLMRSMEIQPNNQEALLALSHLSEKTGDMEQAINYMKIAIQRFGEGSELLLKIADLYMKTGSPENALDYASKAVENDPSNLDAGKLLADIYFETGETEKAWRQYSSVIDEMISTSRSDEAINILNTLKEFDPVECGRKMVFLYKQTGDNEAVFNELIRLSEIYEERDLQEEALDCLKEAALIQPDNAELKDRIKTITKRIVPETETAQEKTVEEVLTEADVFLRYGLSSEARKLLEGLKVRAPENIDVHQKLKSLYIDTSDREQAVTECLILAELYRRAGDEQKKQTFLQEAYEIDPEDPRLAERLEKGEISAAPAPVEKTAPVEEPLSPPPASIENYSEEISEAEFYCKQGFFMEAKEIYNRLLAIFPENEDLRARLQKVEEQLASPLDRLAEPGAPEEIAAEEPHPPGRPTVKPAAPDDEDFSLPDIETIEAHELEEPALESDVLEIFKEFKKGLEKEVEAEDSETHYNLGIAYREMGLIDDAISSFQTSQHDPKLFVQSAAMLGICYMQKGLYSLAADSFQSALMKTDPKDESSWGLKYELAEAYEKEGNLREALRLFTEVYGWNSKFREVAQKITHLKKSVETRHTKKEKKSRVSYI